jgi:hypothetical protein
MNKQGQKVYENGHKNVLAIWLDLVSNLIKLLERFSELSPNLSNKQHFFAQQNVLQNLRHKSVDFQYKIIALTP